MQFGDLKTLFLSAGYYYPYYYLMSKILLKIAVDSISRTCLLVFSYA